MDLRDLRKRAGLKVKTVAAALGVSKGTIDHYEQGTRTPGIANVLILAELYNSNERDVIDAILKSKAKRQKIIKRIKGA